MKYTEKHLEELAGMLPYSINIKNTDRTYKYVNKRLGDWVEHINQDSPIEIIEKKISDIWDINNFIKLNSYHLDQDDETTYIDSIIFNNQKFLSEAHAIVSKDGEDKDNGYIEMTYIKLEEELLNKMVNSSYQDLTDTHNMFIQGKAKCYDQIIKGIISKVIKYLDCDFLTIDWYDKSKEKLCNYIAIGIEGDSLQSVIIENMTQKQLTEIFKGENFQHIKNVSELSKKNIRIDLEKKKIKHVGIYPIEFNQMVQGVISIGYKSENKKIYFMCNYMDKVCQKIVWVIKSQVLVNQLAKEFSLTRGAQKELNDLFEAATDLLCIVDKDGRFKRVNNVWAKKLGYTSEEIKGKSIYEFIYEQDLEETKKMMKEHFNRGITTEIINRYYMADGSLRWLCWNISHTKSKDEVLTIGVARDITRQKECENKRIELEKNLEREKQKNLFFSTISHEFKTPLNIILSVIQIINHNLKDGMIIDSKDRCFNKYLQTISKSSYKTLKMANNLIDLIKMDTRTGKLNYRYYNIVEIIEEITMAVAKYIEDKDISIIFDTEIEECVVSCDDDAIERIMLNLLANAIKSSLPSGEILVNVRTHTHCISVTVQDFGEGIIEDNKGEEIVIDTTQIIWQSKTLGLGLKVVNELVNSHNGSLFIESYKNKGTSITFSLPVQKQDKIHECIYRQDLSLFHLEKCQIELCDI